VYVFIAFLSRLITSLGHQCQSATTKLKENLQNKSKRVKICNNTGITSENWIYCYVSWSWYTWWLSSQVYHMQWRTQEISEGGQSFVTIVWRHKSTLGEVPKARPC